MLYWEPGRVSMVVIEDTLGRHTKQQASINYLCCPLQCPFGLVVYWRYVGRGGKAWEAAEATPGNGGSAITVRSWRPVCCVLHRGEDTYAHLHTRCTVPM